MLYKDLIEQTHLKYDKIPTISPLNFTQTTLEKH